MIIQSKRINWIIWYATTLHFAWAGLVLYSNSTISITAISSVAAVCYSATCVGVWCLIAASLASYSALRNTYDIPGLILLLPQGALLITSAVGAVDAMLLARFADGVIRSREFIIADQFPVLLISVFYMAAVIEPYLRSFLRRA